MRATALLGTMLLLANPMLALARDDQAQDEWGQDEGQGNGELSLREKVELLRSRVKYVFVIFHENESLDHYFRTFPGANGLFSAPRGATPADATPSFVQNYLDTSLKQVTISPFLMPQAVTTAAGKIVPIYPADLISRSITVTRACPIGSTSTQPPASPRTTATRWIRKA